MYFFRDYIYECCFVSGSRRLCLRTKFNVDDAKVAAPHRHVGKEGKLEQPSVNLQCIRFIYRTANWRN